MKNSIEIKAGVYLFPNIIFSLPLQLYFFHLLGYVDIFILYTPIVPLLIFILPVLHSFYHADLSFPFFFTLSSFFFHIFPFFLSPFNFFPFSQMTSADISPLPLFRGVGTYFQCISVHHGIKVKTWLSLTYFLTLIE